MKRVLTGDGYYDVFLALTHVDKVLVMDGEVAFSFSGSRRVRALGIVGSNKNASKLRRVQGK